MTGLTGQRRSSSCGISIIGDVLVWGVDGSESTGLTSRGAEET